MSVATETDMFRAETGLLERLGELLDGVDVEGTAALQVAGAAAHDPFDRTPRRGPGNAVLKVDEGDGCAFDLDYCKGCGICVAECPCGAIEMIPETI
jgi:ferredoxin